VRTFIINEVRFNEKGEAFEVRSKMQFASIDILLRHLRDNPRTLWNGEFAIQEEGTTRVRKYKGFHTRTKETQSTSLPYGEEDYIQDDEKGS